MLTTIISTCSSPVVTLPPVFPPEFAVPLVEFEMPPWFGLVGFGAGAGAGAGAGSGSGVRPVVPRSRAALSLSSATAGDAYANIKINANAIKTTLILREGENFFVRAIMCTLVPLSPRPRHCDS